MKINFRIRVDIRIEIVIENGIVYINFQDAIVANHEGKVADKKVNKIVIVFRIFVKIREVIVENGLNNFHLLCSHIQVNKKISGNIVDVVVKLLVREKIAIKGINGIFEEASKNIMANENVRNFKVKSLNVVGKNRLTKVDLHIRI